MRYACIIKIISYIIYTCSLVSRIGQALYDYKAEYAAVPLEVAILPTVVPAALDAKMKFVSEDQFVPKYAVLTLVTSRPGYSVPASPPVT
jgi:hypothetical protein